MGTRTRRGFLLPLGGALISALSVAAVGSGLDTRDAGASSPALIPSSASIDFGNVALGSYGGVEPGTFNGSGDFFLTNDGASTDTIDLSTGVAITGADPYDWTIVANRGPNQGCPGSGSQIILAPDAACIVEVSFYPGALGLRSATMTITGSDSTSAVVSLSGTGVPTLTATGTFDFGNTTLGTSSGPIIGDESSTGALVIQLNPGLSTDTIDLTTGVTFTGPGANDYAITPGNCPGDGVNTVVLPAFYGEPPPPPRCDMYVYFYPGALGDRSATMTIQGSIGTSVSVNLSGTGTIGYYQVDAHGNVAHAGDAGYYGDAGSAHLNKPIVGMAATGDDGGYWLVASDGGIFNYGDADFYGSTGGIRLNEPIVAMAGTPDAGGYWLVASDGGIFNYGDAGFYGSTGSIHLNKPIVAMAATPDGNGYWLVASDGGIFSYGDAGFYGSTGSIHLNKPIVGMAATPDGNGYWLVASDGGIFSYGDASFYGSTGAIHLAQPIVGMAAMPTGGGYWLSAADGGLFNFGDAPFEGSGVGTGLGQVVGIASDGGPTVQETAGIPAIRQAQLSGLGRAVRHVPPFAGP